VNPSLLNVIVQSGKTFTRNDLTSAVVGEPLTKRRFALNRLSWLTYEGPSADVYASNSSDANLAALMADGIPLSYLLEGTDANIKKYFGLTWDSANHVWDYNVHNGPSGAGPTGPIMQLGAIANLTAPHDPDFFELLKATLMVGSLGKALAYSNTAVATDPLDASSPGDQTFNYNYYSESSVDFQIIQIGANIMAQAQPATYPPQIVFNDGSGQPQVPRTFVGVENLPYLSMVYNGVLQVQQPGPFPRSGKPTYTNNPGTGKSGDSGYQTSDVLTAAGVGAVMQEPVIWNAYDPSSSPGVIGPTQFRVLADSATPDQVISGGTYSSFFVYTASLLGTAGGPNNYSYTASSSSPGYSWFGDSTGGTGSGHAVSLKNPSNGNGNAEIDFQVGAQPTKEICPEPLVLMRPNSVTDNNSNTLTVTVPSTALMNTDPAVKSLVTGGGLPNFVMNAPDMQKPEYQDPPNTSYVGFYLGAFPLAWQPTTGAPCSASQSGAFLARYNGLIGGDGNSCFMTYRLQYKNASGNWVTYDTKYGQAYGGSGVGGFSSCDSTTTANPQNGVLIAGGDYAFATDPRTSRFGLFWESAGGTPVGSGGLGAEVPGAELSFWVNPPVYAAGWLDPKNGILYTLRPDAEGGFFTMAPGNGGWPSTIGATSGWMAHAGSNANAPLGIQPGMLTQNNAEIYQTIYRFYGDGQGANTQSPNYFADPDGMVRRAMGAFVALGTVSSPATSPAATLPAPADTTVGLPMARVFNWAAAGNAAPPSSPDPCITVYSGTPTTSAPTSQAQSRPYFLHRPLDTVTELGYVFSDTPWRNLDFFTAESGNSALLDAFCINDTNDPGGVVAGKVDLNTRQAPVLAAVIGDAYYDPENPTLTGSGTVGQIDSTTASLVAKALVTRTTDTTNLSNGTGPLQNLSDLVGKWIKDIGINDLGSLISGPDQGVLAASNGFYDGKLSYAGFGGGVWDTANHKPYPDYTAGSAISSGGVENFSSTTGAPQATTAPEDIYSAYMSSSTLLDTGIAKTNHKGPQETAAYIQRFREAPIRALAAAGTTRVWNLMIDVVAQTGRFPSSASGLANFNVEGERRYWVHVAIDRYTGKVLDEQIEEVSE
jgi:hypothetical protein